MNTPRFPNSIQKIPVAYWWLTATIMAINCGMFLWQVLHGVSFWSPSVPQMLHWGANFVPLTLTGDLWRMLSSVFLHIGALHLLVNMWALYVFGSYSEVYFGRVFFIGLYLLAGIAGNVASCWWNLPAAQQLLTAQTISQMPMISAGASGAILGLGGALLVAALRPRADLPPQLRLNFRALLVMMAINLSLGLVIDGLDQAAHLGGTLMGLLLGWLYTIGQNSPRLIKHGVNALGLLAMSSAMAYCIWDMLEHSTDLLPIRQEIILELGALL